MNRVITINRQFGSGGREVAKRLADVLGFSYYDKELVHKIAEETKLHPDFIEQYQESVATRQYAFTFGRSFSTPMVSMSEQVQIEQTKIIKEIGEKKDCVIVGRCANYILNEKAFKVFIYSSDMDFRINRCYEKVKEDLNKPRKEIEKNIKSIDKKRAKYHESYTGQKWLEMTNYNLCIDTSKVSVRDAVAMIATLVNR